MLRSRVCARRRHVWMEQSAGQTPTPASTPCSVSSMTQWLQACDAAGRAVGGTRGARGHRAIRAGAEQHGVCRPRRSGSLRPPAQRADPRGRSPSHGWDHLFLPPVCPAQQGTAEQGVQFEKRSKTNRPAVTAAEGMCPGQRFKELPAGLPFPPPAPGQTHRPWGPTEQVREAPLLLCRSQRPPAGAPHEGGFDPVLPPFPTQPRCSSLRRGRPRRSSGQCSQRGRRGRAGRQNPAASGRRVPGRSVGFALPAGGEARQKEGALRKVRTRCPPSPQVLRCRWTSL